jgi:hypothetical protein
MLAKELKEILEYIPDESTITMKKMEHIFYE